MKKNIRLAFLITPILCFFSTKIAYAATGSEPSSALIDSSTTLSTLIQNIIGILGNVVPLLIGAAVVVFLWGVLVFIAKASAGDAEGRSQGINFMIFGIIGITVMVSLWGLVMFITSTIGTTTVVPQFNNNSATPASSEQQHGVGDPNTGAFPN